MYIEIVKVYSDEMISAVRQHLFGRLNFSAAVGCKQKVDLDYTILSTLSKKIEGLISGLKKAPPSYFEGRYLPPVLKLAIKIEKKLSELAP